MRDSFKRNTEFPFKTGHVWWVSVSSWWECRADSGLVWSTWKVPREASVTGNTCKSTALKCLLEAKTNKGNNVDREESHSYVLVMQKKKSLGKRGCGHPERGGGSARKWVRRVGRMPRAFPKFPKTSCPPSSPEVFQKNMGWHLWWVFPSLSSRGQELCVPPRKGLLWDGSLIQSVLDIFWSFLPIFLSKYS